MATGESPVPVPDDWEKAYKFFSSKNLTKMGGTPCPTSIFEIISEEMFLRLENPRWDDYGFHVGRPLPTGLEEKIHEIDKRAILLVIYRCRLFSGWNKTWLVDKEPEEIIECTPAQKHIINAAMTYLFSRHPLETYGAPPAVYDDVKVFNRALSPCADSKHQGPLQKQNNN